LNDKVGADHFYGSFTAPTTGIHGWFWENKGNKPVDIHLTTAGFYDSAKAVDTVSVNVVTGGAKCTRAKSRMSFRLML
jgi:hypothetical protein